MLQSKDAEDAAAEARPTWHWVVIGAGFVVTIWIPLAMIALAIGRMLAGVLGGVALVLSVWVSFSVACLAAGALVGRFGGRAGKRHAMLSGVAGAAGVWLLALFSGALSPWTVGLTSALILPATAAFFARWGGGFGERKRPRV